jgi:hypothetical protein
MIEITDRQIGRKRDRRLYSGSARAALARDG